VGDGTQHAETERAGEAGTGEHHERGAREVRAQRPPVELVQRVRTHAHGKKERAQAGGRATGVNVWRHGGTDRDVAKMPGGVGRVKQCDQIAPATGPQSVEGWALKLGGCGHRSPLRAAELPRAPR
jgi:hypothetical protein